MATRSTIHPKEFAAVLELPAAKRYAHTIAQSADWGALWGLRNTDGWVTSADEFGRPAVALWPHKQYAEACSSGAWAGTAPAEIEIHQVVEELLPGLAREGTKVAVFPTPLGKVVYVDPSQLEADLRTELSKIE
ncbi:MAG: DUF2750 domain-containing protein [Rhizobiaceae bacterium]|jgi:hypothetical protein|nr:DUF2750 domain-containing protein [Rhizobiaceae bacterium]